MKTTAKICLPMVKITSDSPDEQLVVACRDGNETAWELIVYKYQNLIFSVPRRAGLDRDAASDVLQEVFKTLFEKLDSLEQPQFLRAWLTTTARHKTIHYIQKEKRGKIQPLFDEENEINYEIPDRAPLPDEVLVRLEKENQVELALSKIDDRCRRLLTMLYFETEQIPYQQISETLDLPLGSIGPTRARCLKKLLKFLPE